jgi:NAD(P)H-hydrate repair Nnr-like enzyme with NAD(P)H-hydrate dehydratase domain
MHSPSFVKQSQEPLYPQILWNRPLSRHSAGRILLVGGHSGGFSVLQAFYQLALAGGIGQCQLVLPDSLRPILAGTPDSIFVPSGPSGSLAKAALAAVLDLAHDFDTCVIGPDLSQNSETTVLVESLLEHLERPVVLVGDGLVVGRHQPARLMDKAGRLIIATPKEVLDLAGKRDLALPIKYADSALNKLAIMETVSRHSRADWVMVGRELITASKGQLSLTNTVSEMDFFQPTIAALAAVFWTQQPGKPFEALTTAAFILRQVRQEIAEPSADPLTTAEVARAIGKILLANENPT